MSEGISEVRLGDKTYLIESFLIVQEQSQEEREHAAEQWIKNFEEIVDSYRG